MLTSIQKIVKISLEFPFKEFLEHELLQFVYESPLRSLFEKKQWHACIQTQMISNHNYLPFQFYSSGESAMFSKIEWSAKWFSDTNRKSAILHANTRS